MHLLNVGLRAQLRRGAWRRHQLQSRCYRTETAVFGFCPLTKQAINFSDEATINFRKHQEGVSKDNIPVQCLVKAFRDHGHLVAKVNPLDIEMNQSAEWMLDPKAFALGSADSVADLAFPSDSQLASERLATVDDLVNKLRHFYCGNMTVEVSHMVDPAEREWFCNEYERMSTVSLDPASRTRAAILMKQSMAFENMMSSRFNTAKRYAGEGCDAMLAIFDQLFNEAARSGVEHVVMAMAHRGRLNVLTSLLKLPPVQIFQKVRGLREWPDDIQGAGDVLSHLSNNTSLEYPSGNVCVTMIPNPSHLEAANPVAVGKVRAKQKLLDDGDYCQDASRPLSHKTLCLQVHGDAAFSGQGVIQETLGLSGVPHYSVGGSIHLIVNNQLGFTTDAERGRKALTSKYTSCISKMNSIPIIRVNGEDPDALMRAAMIAMSYRNAWQKDIVVDVLCYRRYGHNELDNPSFTQPLMYKIIDSLRPLPDTYAEKLVDEGVCSREDISGPEKEWSQYLSDQFDAIETSPPQANHLEKQWSGLAQAGHDVSSWDTGVDQQLLRFVAVKSVELPSDFNAHPTLMKSHVDRRREKMQANTAVDWATAESMAFGTLMSQGFDVRISGQDVGRGTFSHRHAMLVDQDTDAIYIPLNHMYEEQSNFLEICNSILSEEAVLGFEYGFSIESPKCLTIWEAQFGDFFNGAQIMIDTYVTTGETKWLRQSGLVMMLPTGMDGAGPEHSSCRIERFLQLTDSREEAVDGDSVNISVANPTTPAQYFHLLRRQMLRNFQKPLILAAPKTLLRLPGAVSSVDEMSPGSCFLPVIDDSSVDKAKVTKVVFCSGKHFYTLNEEREARNITDTALVRVEEICPFPTQALQAVTQAYPAAKHFTWAQEEHRNSGCWTFIRPRFENLVGVKLRYAGREELATPATGVGKVHKAECSAILDSAFSS